MKMLICGKGGSGKSTLAALLAQSFARKGNQVLLIDADESNQSLNRLLGMEAPPPFMDSFGGKKGFKAAMNSAFQGNPDSPLAQRQLGIADLPAAYLSRRGNLSLMAIGKIHHFGEGCACPMGVLSKSVLGRIATGADEVVIVDTEAGMEHFGRRVDAECDLILAMVDPSFESFTMAGRILEMGRDAGLAVLLVLNRVDARVAPVMAGQVDNEKVAARIPADDTIFLKSLEGHPLDMPVPQVDALRDFIVHQAGGSAAV